VTTSGEVASGETASVTLRNRSDATLRGNVEIDPDVLQLTDGSVAASVAFELAPGEQKAIVLRALPAATRRSSEVAVDVRSATRADGSAASATIDGSTTISVVPR
jgi:hypothetical protein